jgi:hypothetical protein
MQVAGVWWEVLQDARRESDGRCFWMQAVGVRRAVHQAAVVRLQVRRAVRVRREVVGLQAAWVRLEVCRVRVSGVRWCPGCAQRESGALGCTRQGSGRKCLGMCPEWVRWEVCLDARGGGQAGGASGCAWLGLVGGASGCFWQESGRKGLGMHDAWFRREVQQAEGVRLKVHPAAGCEVRRAVSGKRCIGQQRSGVRCVRQRGSSGKCTRLWASGVRGYVGLLAGGTQVGGALGCPRWRSGGRCIGLWATGGQASSALGGGGLVGGALGCPRWESGGRCFGMQAVGVR